QVIVDVAVDREDPERAVVVLTFDNDAFLATKDGGRNWTTLGSGLKRTDLKHVYAAPSGWWASVNAGGWMKYDETTNKWTKAGLLVADASPAAAPTKGKKGAAVAAKKPVAAKSKAPQLVAFQVNDMEFAPNAWFAATAGGVLVSKDKGATWKTTGDALAKQSTNSIEISADGSQVWAITQKSILYSADSGVKWDAKELAFSGAGNLRLHRVDDQTLLITSNMGLYASKDGGRNWNRTEVRDLQFQDAAGS